VIETIIKTNSDRIIYVSCNAATQARDLELLKDHYKTEITQAVDMFPHTHHTENICS
jgi:23S rRNA (uracil1939-C5)-methyltransferase